MYMYYTDAAVMLSTIIRLTFIDIHLGKKQIATVTIILQHNNYLFIPKTDIDGMLVLNISLQTYLKLFSDLRHLFLYNYYVYTFM